MKPFLAAALATIMLAGTAAAAPRVVVSIKPIHGIVAAVMQGVGKPDLLIDAAISEHTAQLKPSQLELLTGADLIVVVGENLEAFLHTALDNPDIASRNVLEVERTRGITLLPVREDKNFEKDNDEGEGHGATDPHIWMDPRNAAMIAESVASELGRIDPGNETRYKSNAARFEADLDRLQTEIEARIAPVRSKPFIVFHDAYHYFEKRFGMHAVGSITLNPEAMPGARRLADIQQRIRDTGAACVFAEPQFDIGYVKTVIEGTGARESSLDGLGAAIPAGPGAYEALLDSFVTSLTSCLSG